MDSHAKVLGHPLHQMLIVFPLGLFATAAIFDGIHLATGNQLWTDVSFWIIMAGLVGALVAAPAGVIDWLAIPRGTRAKMIGAWHGGGNLLVVALFALSLYFRWINPGWPGPTAFILSFSGIGVALVTAWLGGELVDRLGVGVDAGANLNASSSLSNSPASTPSDGRRPDGRAPAHG